MRIKHRLIFDNCYTDIAKILDKKGAEYDRCETFTVLDLFEDNKDFLQIIKTFEYYNIKPIISETIFSLKEIEESKWLNVRSTWRFGYPQPQTDMQYRNTTYDSSHYCKECGNGLVQKENFILKKEPNWGPRVFFMTNWVHDELFVSDRAALILQNSNLNGFAINNVLKPSKQVMGTVKQIYIKNSLNNGLMQNSINEKIICPKCNFKKYLLNTGFIKYDKKIFENIGNDIVKTNEKFGEITCSSLIFITQKFYEIIIKNKFDRGLIFTPISASTSF